MEFAIRCSFVEIYLENIRDLLNPDSAALEVREDPELGVHVRGATEVYVTASAEMLEVMRAGSENRVVASTGMNQGSSRSHSMFIITLAQKNETDGSLKTSRLYLVDLAGNEWLHLKPGCVYTIRLAAGCVRGLGVTHDPEPKGRLCEEEVRVYDWGYKRDRRDLAVTVGHVVRRLGLQVRRRCARRA